MTQYLLSVYMIDGQEPRRTRRRRRLRRVGAVNEEMKAGRRVGIRRRPPPARTATVVRMRDGEMLLTDGPFRRGKEQLGGFGSSRRPTSTPRSRWARKATVACAAAGRGAPLPGRWRLARDVDVAAATIEHVFREESGRAVACLVRVCGDIDLAEEAVQEAFLIASERWPETGVPPNPAGWIITTARNRAIDRSGARRHATIARRRPFASTSAPIPTRRKSVHDDRLAPDLHVLPSRARARARRWR